MIIIKLPRVIYKLIFLTIDKFHVFNI